MVDAPDVQPLPEIKGDIEFRNLTFRYPDGEFDALRNISFSIKAGESIGYSRRTVVDSDSRIAAIPIGYADGLNRRLGNRNCYCMVGGKKAPYVGNICMDVCMIDVTDIDCKEGDIITIFGDELPVSVLSDSIGTIPYEVLTGISTRVQRVYIQE
jgi:alanine racemase